MGSLLSNVWGPEDWDTPDLTTGLTPRHRQALHHTWAMLQPQMRATGVALFLALFKAHPQHQARFAAFAGTPLPDLARDKRLAAHASNVVFAVSALLDALDDPECLQEMLRRLGTSHRAHRVPASAFVDLQAVFLQLLRSALGSQLTPVAEEAWATFLSYVTHVMAQHLQSNED